MLHVVVPSCLFRCPVVSIRYVACRCPVAYICPVVSIRYVKYSCPVVSIRYVTCFLVGLVKNKAKIVKTHTFC